MFKTVIQISAYLAAVAFIFCHYFAVLIALGFGV